jgi:hypothetical protein
LIPSRRRQFNAAYTPEKYARFLGLLQDRFGEPVQFRHSETPVFLPERLVNEMATAGREMVEQLLADPAYLEASTRAVPPRWCAPNESPRPLFVQADFGLDENHQPKLVEIQGFPSLYAYQPLIARTYRVAYGIDDGLPIFPNGLPAGSYYKLLTKAIVAEHTPENVVLLEVDPTHQKTRHDFVMTAEQLGIAIVDIREVVKQGNRLYYRRDGELIPIHRIYNRAIPDELERRGVELPFDFRGDLDVEWAGHLNWFFRLSKFSLPWIHHPAAPRTVYLSDTAEIDDPSRYVLKPLYSFAGAGVVVGPTREQIAAVPQEQRSNYVLQERVNFQPVIDTPFGPTKIEVRIMYLWLDELMPVNIIIRMGRGSQMGVDFNKGMDWVGGSAAFLDSGETE